MNTTQHVFEQAGLGKAPFRLTSVEEKAFTVAGTTINRAGSTCQFCGTAIRQVFNIVGADGSQFHVGCKCVEKTGDRGLIDTVKREANRIKREAKFEKDSARVAKARENLESVRTTLSGHPHPSIEGRTLADYVEWMLQHAGMAGCLKAAKIIEAAG